MKLTLGTLRRGAAGSAQEIIAELERTDPPDWSASIGGWLIDAPGQSPAWRHYMLMAIHLRPIDGVKPARIHEPGATHEFLMYALDPDKTPDPLNPNSWAFLRPCNLAEQVKLQDDASAANLLQCAVIEVVAGKLWAEPPLSSQVEPWRSYLRHWARAFDLQRPH